MTAFASFEDFLYIIIGLLWVVYSFYNAKKKKDKKNAPAQTSGKKSILESLINELGIQDKQPEPSLYQPSDDINHIEPEPVHVETEEPSEVFSYDDYYEESNYNTIDNVIEKKPPLPMAKIDEAYSLNKKSSSKKGVRNKIDLRKAVIYSEILKKVYF